MKSNKAEATVREEYYAELETLEPDARLKEAMEAAQRSDSQRRLFEVWAKKNSPHRRTA